MLLREEMRRVRQFLEWKAMWWESRADGWSGLDPIITEGICAYAHRQAKMQRALRSRFTQLWEAPLNLPSRSEDTGEGDEDPGLDSVCDQLHDDEQD
jgi:hypothetical protein